MPALDPDLGRVDLFGSTIAYQDEARLPVGQCRRCTVCSAISRLTGADLHLPVPEASRAPQRPSRSVRAARPVHERLRQDSSSRAPIRGVRVSKVALPKVFIGRCSVPLGHGSASR
jgi:hypothetical protein